MLVTPEHRPDVADSSPVQVAPPAEPERIAEAVHRGPSGRPEDLMPGHRLVRVTDGPLWDRAEAFVHDLYVRIGYTEPAPDRRVRELARYADQSFFNVVLDEDDRIVGSLRNIMGAYDDLPIGAFERTVHTDPDPVCEMSSLVVDPRVRSTGVIEHLYRAGWRDAWRAGASAMVGLMDEWLLDVFVNTYRLDFAPIGVAKDYMGTHPLPASIPLHHSAYRRQSVENPRGWAWMIEGVLPQEIVDWELPIILANDDELERRRPDRGVDEGITPPAAYPAPPPAAGA